MVTCHPREGAWAPAPGEPKTSENTAADCCSIRVMKNVLSIVSTLFIGFTLTLTACGKDKKPAAAEPAAAEPAKTEPAKTEPAKTDPAAAAPKADDKKADDKGGW